MFNIYKTYNQAKDVFVKPKLKFSVCFGKYNFYKNRIRIGRIGQYYYTNNTSRIKIHSAGDILEDGSIVKYDKYETSNHKLPIKNGTCVWVSSIRKTLKKYHLGWLKPVYYLPIWLSFDFNYHDVFYKWKYNDISFEAPPTIFLTIFGFTLEWTLVPKLEDENDNECFYWESLLSYLYHDECKRNVRDTLFFCGEWINFSHVKESHFQLRKSHLKKDYHKTYDDAVIEYKLIKEINKRN